MLAANTRCRAAAGLSLESSSEEERQWEALCQQDKDIRESLAGMLKAFFWSRRVVS